MKIKTRHYSYWEKNKRFREYDHPVVRFFANKRIALIYSWLVIAKVKKVLDIGCGNGISTFYMHEFVKDIWGVDQSMHMLRGFLRFQKLFFICMI